MFPRQFAIIALVIGFLLLTTGVVQFVTGRDLHQAGSTALTPADTSSIVLSAVGIILCFGGTAIFVRHSRALLTILGGGLLLATAWTQSIFSTESQRREQTARELEWSKVVRKSQQRDPRALPPGRPVAPPVAGSGFRIVLVAVGVALVLGGFGELLGKHRGK